VGFKSIGAGGCLTKRPRVKSGGVREKTLPQPISGGVGKEKGFPLGGKLLPEELGE